MTDENVLSDEMLDVPQGDKRSIIFMTQAVYNRQKDRADLFERLLRKAQHSIVYSYNKAGHGFDCPICHTMTPLPEQTPRHTEDCLWSEIECALAPDADHAGMLRELTDGDA